MKASRLLAPSTILLFFFLWSFAADASGTGIDKGGKPMVGAQPQVSAATEDTAVTPDNQQRVDVLPSTAEAGQGSLMSHWLHMLDNKQSTKNASGNVLAFAPEFPGDLVEALNSIGESESKTGFFGVLWRSVIAIGCGFLTAFIFMRASRRRVKLLQSLTPPDNQRLALFWAGLMRNIPALVGLLPGNSWHSDNRSAVQHHQRHYFRPADKGNTPLLHS